MCMVECAGTCETVAIISTAMDLCIYLNINVA